MKSANMVAAELVAAGYVQPTAVAEVRSILTKFQADAAAAAETKSFAEEDMAHQAQITAEAEDLAQIDLEMGQIEDRFIQDDIMNNAAALAGKDKALFERAEAEIAAACTEAAWALSRAGLIASTDLEAVTRLIASLWETSDEENEHDN